MSIAAATAVMPSYADERAERADMVDVGEAARLAGVTPATLQRMAARRRPRAIVIRHTTLGLRFPRWQFAAPLWPVVQQLGAARSCSGLEMIAWLESPLGAFNGRTPRAALEQGEPPGRVLDIAGCDE
jgi:transposase InsO family protein